MICGTYDSCSTFGIDLLGFIQALLILVPVKVKRAACSKGKMKGCYGLGRLTFTCNINNHMGKRLIVTCITNSYVDKIVNHFEGQLPLGTWITRKAYCYPSQLLCRRLTDIQGWLNSQVNLKYEMSVNPRVTKYFINPVETWIWYSMSISVQGDRGRHGAGVCGRKASSLDLMDLVLYNEHFI